MALNSIISIGLYLTNPEFFPRFIIFSLGFTFALVGFIFLSFPKYAINFIGLDMINTCSVSKDVVCHSNNGYIEVNAFYGGLEIALGAYFMLSCFYLDLESSIVLGFLAFLGTGSCRIVSHAYLYLVPWLIHQNMPFNQIDWLQFLIGVAELGTSALVAVVWRVERKNKRRRELRERLRNKKQIPNPTKLEEFVPFCAENLENPYPFYEALRNEAPFYKVPGLDNDEQFWLVSRYDDIVNVCKRTEEFSSNFIAFLIGESSDPSDLSVRKLNRPSFLKDIGVVDVLALQDPPKHTIQRKIAFSGLTPKLFKSMDEWIERETTQLFEKIGVNTQSLSLSEDYEQNFIEIEWMTQFAHKLPMIVALHLVGMPTDDHIEIKKYADNGVALLNLVNTPQDFANHVLEASKLVKLVDKHWEIMADKFSNGDDIPFASEFLFSLLKGVYQSKEITDNEAKSMILQILFAGNDSSASTIGSTVEYLVSHPEMQDLLRNDPIKIPDFIEEIIRLESPFSGHFRKVVVEEGINVGKDLSTHIPYGSRILCLWASGNRDERQFEKPNEVVLGRKNAKSHLSFGSGIHTCLGATLARIEVHIVLKLLLRLSTNVELSDKSFKVNHLPQSFVRTLRALPIRIHIKNSSG